MEEAELPNDPTPTDYCVSALRAISILFNEIAPHESGDKGKFLSVVVGHFFEKGYKGEELAEESFGLDAYQQPPWTLRSLLIATAYACQGVMADLDENKNKAWANTICCQQWLGFSTGIYSIKKDGLNPLQEFSRLGTDARHKENRAMKQEVFQWLDENMRNYRSMDAAATMIAGGISPITWRTARDWIKQWKDLRSPGRP